MISIENVLSHVVCSRTYASSVLCAFRLRAGKLSQVLSSVAAKCAMCYVEAAVSWFTLLTDYTMGWFFQYRGGFLKADKSAALPRYYKSKSLILFENIRTKSSILMKFCFGEND